LNGSNYVGFGTSLNGDTLVTLFSSTSYNLDRWYHAVFVMNTTHKVIYVDGQIASLGSDSSIVTGRNGNVMIGAVERSGSTPDLWFNGTIDEVAIWDRDLSTAEILSIYNHTNTSFYPIFQNETSIPNGTYI